MSRNWITGLAIALFGTHLAGAEPAPPPAPNDLEQTYHTVLSHLDPGGNFLVYLNSTDAVQHLLDHLTELVNLLPDEEEEVALIQSKVHEAAAYLVELGANDLLAFGASSVPTVEGSDHLKVFLARKQDGPDRPLWNLRFKEF